MTDAKDKKAYCDAQDQKTVVEKMTDCDRTAKTDKERQECYDKAVKGEDSCMSS